MGGAQRNNTGGCGQHLQIGAVGVAQNQIDPQTSLDQFVGEVNTHSADAPRAELGGKKGDIRFVIRLHQQTVF